jgi:hypothetical protein
MFFFMWFIIFWFFLSSGGTTLKKTRAAKAKLKIQEFAEEKEDRDPQPQDLIQISRKNEGRQIRQKLRGR